MPKDKKVYLYFSLGTALTTIATLSLDKNIYLNNLAIINSLQFVTLVIAVAFLCHDLWYKNLKDEHIGIIFYLSIKFFSSTSLIINLAFLIKLITTSFS